MHNFLQKFATAPHNLNSRSYPLSRLAPCKSVIRIMPHQDIEALGYSALGLLILAIDIAVIFEVMQSQRDLLEKVLWTLLILFFPLLGVLFYLLFSGRTRHHYTVVA